jgi:hypothetical protein
MTGPSNSHAKASPSELKPAHMLLSPFRRRRRQCWSWVRLVFVFLFVLFVCDALLTITSNPPLTRVSPSTTGLGDRIFIASMHWNNEYIIRTHWSHAVLDLVKHFGPENTYVAIIESGSWDNTKDALRELDHELGKLGVERYIELSETTHKDEIERVPEQDQEGWIWTPRGRKELRRIPYLAGIRNRVMAKLKELAEKVGNGKRTFDKILWLNDVIFTVILIRLHLCSRHAPMLITVFRRPKTSPLFSRQEMEIMQQPVPSTSQSHRNTTTPSLFAIFQAQRRQPKSGLFFSPPSHVAP